MKTELELEKAKAFNANFEKQVTDFRSGSIAELEAQIPSCQKFHTIVSGTDYKCQEDFSQ